MRPVNPPSIFEGTNKSSIPKPPPKDRPTSLSFFEARTRQEDQLEKFKQLDLVDFKLLVDASDKTSKLNKNYPGGKRQKTLTKDTATALHHTLNGLVDLSRKLLSTTHKYVLIGEHTSDPLEKEFGKLRQGSGGE